MDQLLKLERPPKITKRNIYNFSDAFKKIARDWHDHTSIDIARRCGSLNPAIAADIYL
jgi:hypothetical protein